MTTFTTQAPKATGQNKAKFALASEPSRLSTEAQFESVATSFTLLKTMMHRMLANTYVLGIKTQNIHWNGEGSLFYSAHEITDGIYHELAKFIDRIAERIRAIEETVPATLHEMIELASIEDNTSALDLKGMLTSIVADFEKTSKDAKQTVIVAESKQDSATADLATELIDFCDHQAWMLRSLIK